MNTCTEREVQTTDHDHMYVRSTWPSRHAPSQKHVAHGGCTGAQGRAWHSIASRLRRRGRQWMAQCVKKALGSLSSLTYFCHARVSVGLRAEGGGYPPGNVRVRQATGTRGVFARVPRRHPGDISAGRDISAGQARRDRDGAWPRRAAKRVCVWLPAPSMLMATPGAAMRADVKLLPCGASHPPRGHLTSS